MFDFLKKSAGDAPPDVGKEEEFEAEQKEKKPILKPVGVPPGIPPGGKKVLVKKGKKVVVKPVTAEPVVEVSDAEAEVVPKVSSVPVKSGVSAGISKLEVDRLNARVEALQSLLKSFNERFSVVGQQIGEVRAMNLATEKAMSRSKIESSKATDIVKEVKPDKLRIDYQKLDIKMATLAEKIEANNQYAKTVMNEVKGLRQKAGVFLGTDALLQLNDDVKKDLIQLQKMSSRVRINADKSEQLFVELREGFADSQKLSGMVQNLDSFASDLKEEIDKLKLDHSEIVKQKDFGSFQKNVNNKFLGIDSTVEEIEKVKGENERLGRVIEDIFSVVKRNQEDIGTIGINVGSKGVKKVDDYDSKILEILRVMEKMAVEVKEIKMAKRAVKMKKVVNPKVKSKIAEEIEVVKPKVNPKVKSKIAEEIEVVKPKIVEKIKPPVVKKVEEIRGVRDVDEIAESAVKSQEKPEPIVPVKKIVKPVSVVKKENVEIGNIENELKKIRDDLGDSDVEKVSLDVNETEEKNIFEKERKKKIVKKKKVVKKVREKEPEKKDMPKRVFLKKKNSKKDSVEKARKTRKKNANKKAKLKASRLRNLKKARDAKKMKREVMLKNLKKARAVKKKKSKKK